MHFMGGRGKLVREQLGILRLHLLIKFNSRFNIYSNYLESLTIRLNYYDVSIQQFYRLKFYPFLYNLSVRAVIINFH